jgi:NADPH:quinone reductase-like Zn-dependent oxidoreductase
MMKAIQFVTFGGPDVLRLTEIPVPPVGPNQVRVRVKTAGVNPVDAKIRQGSMQAMFPTPLPHVPGLELAGVVDAVGEGLTGVAPGDEVLGRADGGSYAEFALSSRFARKPADIGWEVAAALPIAGETAMRVLGELDLRSGETLIVHGAAGGVGSLAVQLAVARGVKVIGTASQPNQDYVRSLGAIPVVYGEGLVGRVRAIAPDGVDAAFDVAGKGALQDSIELTGTPARVVTIADPSASALGVRFSTGNPADPSPGALAELVRLYAGGAIRLTVAATFPLEEAAEAHRISEAGHVRGKLVISVS